MPITKLTRVIHVRPSTPPPRIIVGILTGEEEVDPTEPAVQNKTPVPPEGNRRSLR